MKKLILCCDGTWNKADQVEHGGQPCVTNVLKIAVRIAKHDKNNTPQVIYYDQGVGTGNFLDKIIGGAFGDGLIANIFDAYRFLVGNYELGDEIYLFGFSRGAFTARSIAGMVRKCGILSRAHVDKYHDALTLYHSNVHPDDAPAVAFRAANSISPQEQIPIKFIGVWDTVGSLGIPFHEGLRFDPKDYEFFDTELSGTVKYAYHALAIDERRGSFEPTLWDYKPKPDQTVEQVWFAGVHSDVGGGYFEAGLSDITLRWMLDKAEGAGLELDETALTARPLHRDAEMEPHDSMKNVYQFMPKYDRPVGEATKNSKNKGPNGLDPTQSLHPSVLEHWDKVPTYRPANLLRYFQLTGDPHGGAPAVMPAPAPAPSPS